MLDTLLLYDEKMIEHDPGPGHPERPDRLRAIEVMLSMRSGTRTRLSRAVAECWLLAPPEVTTASWLRLRRCAGDIH